MDYQCPYCTNNSLCQHNSLLTMAPAVAAYWYTAKNGLTPDQVMARSTTRRHWLCPSCGHSWQAMIYTKVDGQSGCPKCSIISKPWSRRPSLTQSQHPAMLEFDFERNCRAGLDPDKITAGSDKMVHWICTKCPKGQSHLFVASPRCRIGLNRGCPCCASRKACICNSLQSLYPALAAAKTIEVWVKVPLWQTVLPGCILPWHLQKRKKCMPFNNHNGTLLRQQPGVSALIFCCYLSG